VGEGGADAANDFAGPEFFGEEDEGAIFEIADGAEKVAGEGFVVGVDAVAGEFTFEGSIAGCERGAGAGAERLVLKAIEESFESGLLGRRNDERMLGGVAEGDLVAGAVVAKAIEVAEEIERPRVGGGGGDKDAGPDGRGAGAADRLAVLAGFGEIEADGADVVAEVERLDVKKVVCGFGRSGHPRRILSEGSVRSERGRGQEAVGELKLRSEKEPARCRRYKREAPIVRTSCARRDVLSIIAMELNGAGKAGASSRTP